LIKLAVCFVPEKGNAESVATAMAESMRLTDEQQCSTVMLGSGALACVKRSNADSSLSHLHRGLNGNLLAIAGVPIRLGGSLDACLKRTVEQGYKEAISGSTELDGAFVAVFWDAKARKLLVITDPLGLQPLYVARVNGAFLIASELKAFPASKLMAAKMDPAGWGAFFSFDFNIGVRTQLAGVLRVKAATILTYSPRKNQLESKSYWSYPEPNYEMKQKDVDIGHLLDVISCEIKQYMDHSAVNYLLLSGGFDSRLIMFLLKKNEYYCPAVIIDHKDEMFGLDGRLGIRVAKKFNKEDWRLVSTSPRFYESPAFLKYLVMGEVAVPCLNLFISQISQNLYPEMKAVWDGLCIGSAFKPAYPHLKTIDEYLTVRCRPMTSLHWEAAKLIFSETISEEMIEGFSKLLEQELGELPNDEFGVSKFQMDNRKRHCIALNPLKVYANHVLPFIPGASRVFWNTAGRIPRSLTLDGKMYWKIYSKFFPEAMSVAFCSGGAIYRTKKYTPILQLIRVGHKLKRYSRYFLYRGFKMENLSNLIYNKLSFHSASNALDDFVIQHINEEQSDLNADAVMKIKRMRPPFDWKTRIARHHLFYWQVWRWIMEGTLTTTNAEIFFQENPFQRG
jgi:hypothetical protein